jgi:hypothetical protein
VLPERPKNRHEMVSRQQAKFFDAEEDMDPSR